MKHNRHHSLANLPRTDKALNHYLKNDLNLNSTKSPGISQKRTATSHINNFKGSDYYQAKELKTHIEKLLHQKQGSVKNMTNVFENKNQSLSLGDYRNKYQSPNNNYDTFTPEEPKNNTTLVDMELLNHSLRKDTFNLCVRQDDPSIQKNRYKPIHRQKFNSQLLDFVFNHDKLDHAFQKKLDEYNTQFLPKVKDIAQNKPYMEQENQIERIRNGIKSMNSDFLSNKKLSMTFKDSERVGASKNYIIRDRGFVNTRDTHKTMTNTTVSFQFKKNEDHFSKTGEKFIPKIVINPNEEIRTSIEKFDEEQENIPENHEELEKGPDSDHNVSQKNDTSKNLDENNQSPQKEECIINIIGNENGSCTNRNTSPKTMTQTKDPMNTTSYRDRYTRNSKPFATEVFRNTHDNFKNYTYYENKPSPYSAVFMKSKEINEKFNNHVTKNKDITNLSKNIKEPKHIEAAKKIIKQYDEEKVKDIITCETTKDFSIIDGKRYKTNDRLLHYKANTILHEEEEKSRNYESSVASQNDIQRNMHPNLVEQNNGLSSFIYAPDLNIDGTSMNTINTDSKNVNNKFSDLSDSKNLKKKSDRLSKTHIHKNNLTRSRNNLESDGKFVGEITDFSNDNRVTFNLGFNEKKVAFHQNHEDSQQKKANDFVSHESDFVMVDPTKANDDQNYMNFDIDDYRQSMDNDRVKDAFFSTQPIIYNPSGIHSIKGRETFFGTTNWQREARDKSNVDRVRPGNFQNYKSKNISENIKRRKNLNQSNNKTNKFLNESVSGQSLVQSFFKRSTNLDNLARKTTSAKRQFLYTPVTGLNYDRKLTQNKVPFYRKSTVKETTNDKELWKRLFDNRDKTQEGHDKCCDGWIQKQACTVGQMCKSISSKQRLNYLLFEGFVGAMKQSDYTQEMDKDISLGDRHNLVHKYNDLNSKH